MTNLEDRINQEPLEVRLAISRSHPVGCGCEVCLQIYKEIRAAAVDVTRDSKHVAITQVTDPLARFYKESAEDFAAIWREEEKSLNDAN